MRKRRSVGERGVVSSEEEEEEMVEVVGREVQDETVERREVYFSDWEAVRGGGGCGWEEGSG